jgi:hypothetical protein
VSLGVGFNDTPALEILVKRFRIWVFQVPVTTVVVGLPNVYSCAVEWPALLVHNLAAHENFFAGCGCAMTFDM